MRFNSGLDLGSRKGDHTMCMECTGRLNSCHVFKVSWPPNSNGARAKMPPRKKIDGHQSQSLTFFFLHHHLNVGHMPLQSPLQNFLWTLKAIEFQGISLPHFQNRVFLKRGPIFSLFCGYLYLFAWSWKKTMNLKRESCTYLYPCVFCGYCRFTHVSDCTRDKAAAHCTPNSESGATNKSWILLLFLSSHCRCTTFAETQHHGATLARRKQEKNGSMAKGTFLVWYSISVF